MSKRTAQGSSQAERLIQASDVVAWMLARGLNPPVAAQAELRRQQAHWEQTGEMPAEPAVASLFAIWVALNPRTPAEVAQWQASIRAFEAQEHDGSDFERKLKSLAERQEPGQGQESPSHAASLADWLFGGPGR